MRPLSIMIVADHPIMRDGLRLLLQQESDMQVVCETSEVTRIGAHFIRCKPDITLVDLQVPRAALTAVSTIHRLAKRAAIVLLTTFPDEPDAALRICDRHVVSISKTSTGEELIAAIRKAARLKEL